MKEENNNINDLVVSRGRPTNYRPEMCDKIIEVAGRGGHIAEMRLSIGVYSKETWYEWKEKYPEFAEAVRIAELVSLVWWERYGRDNLTTKNFSATSYAMIMNNKFKDDYSRTGSGNTEITINTVNLSPEQLEQKIAQKLDKLRTLGITLDSEPVSQ